MKLQKSIRFNVRLFYSEQDNLTSKLKDFFKRYDGKVNFAIRISSTEYQQINDVWYQIFRKKTMINLKKNYLILSLVLYF